VAVADDQRVSPTYVPDLADATLDLTVDGERGVWHVANSGAVSWYELLRRAASGAGLPTDLVRPAPTRRLGLVAPRPAMSALSTERAQLAPPLDDGLARYLAAVPARPSAAA
jgi:dTDP-4-dehydrorhamnose reductase